MKYGILGCILFLILIGVASAISVDPAIVKQTIQAPAIASVPVLNIAAITFDSSVHGATVYLDGSLLGADEMHSKTPVTDNEVPAGDHTATFKLTGYKDSVSSFHVEAGKPLTIYAQLQQSPGVAARQSITTLSPQVSLHIQDITIRPITTTTTMTFTTTPPMMNCPAGYTCMSPDQALNSYGAGNYSQYSETLCAIGQTTSGRSVNEYCFAPTVKSVPRVSINSDLVRQVGGGQDSGKGDEGRTLPEGQLPLVVAAPPVQTNTGFLETIFGSIFGGLFGAAPKPPMGGNLTGPTIPPGTGFVLDAYWVAPVIDHGATIYIGEERLNVTHALNQAVGTNPAAAPSAGYDDAVPTLTRIGWYLPGSDPFTVPPTKTIDLGVGGRYRSMKVEPSDFVGYYGTWYLLDASGIKPYGSYPVFIVRDPVLHLNVNNAASGADIGGAQVTSGDRIRFSVNKSIGVTESTGNRRSPITNSPSDGFLDIVVTAPDGSTLTQLDTLSAGGSPGVADLKRLCWDDPAGSPCNPGYTWNTGAKYGNGTAKYPPGTYSVQVISKLNNMQSNYKNGGQLYVGKTVSEKITFTLV
jgi:hypothetical protein